MHPQQQQVQPQQQQVQPPRQHQEWFKNAPQQPQPRDEQQPPQQQQEWFKKNSTDHVQPLPSSDTTNPTTEDVPRDSQSVTTGPSDESAVLQEKLKEAEQATREARGEIDALKSQLQLKSTQMKASEIERAPGLPQVTVVAAGVLMLLSCVYITR